MHPIKQLTKFYTASTAYTVYAAYTANTASTAYTANIAYRVAYIPRYITIWLERYGNVGFCISSFMLKDGTDGQIIPPWTVWAIGHIQC